MNGGGSIYPNWDRAVESSVKMKNISAKILISNLIYRVQHYWRRVFGSSPVDLQPKTALPGSALPKYIPLNRKFSALFDGIPCQFVGVEQFSPFMKM